MSSPLMAMTLFILAGSHHLTSATVSAFASFRENIYHKGVHSTMLAAALSSKLLHCPLRGSRYYNQCRINQLHHRMVKVADFADDDPVLLQESHQILQAHFAFPLDPWQLASGHHLLSNCNLIVCAPTGAGKTVVGEMALRIALDRSRKAIYTTPLKALSNQKFGEMRKVFGVDKVGLATGDVTIRRGADVTIMTAEVYRNMAWRASSLSSLSSVTPTDTESVSIEKGRILQRERNEYVDLSNNSMVVLDEFHYMGQKGRGSTWEECIITNPPQTQVVALSATLPNAKRLAAWIQSVTGRKTVLIEAGGKRPVPLRYYFVTRREFSPLFRDEDAGPGAPHGLLGLRGDGVDLLPNQVLRKKKKEIGFGAKKDTLIERVSYNNLPRGLDLHPTLQSAAEKRMANIDRRVNRMMTEEGYDSYDGNGGGRRMSFREQKRVKESMLKAELKRSVPSIFTLLQRLKDHNLLPAIFFIFSRLGCDNAAQVLCENLKADAKERDAKKAEKIQRKNRKVSPLKGKGRTIRRRHSQTNEWDVSDDKLGIIQDADGRNFRADLLDHLLSDEFDDSSPNQNDLMVNKNMSFISDENLLQYADIGLLDFSEVKNVAYRVLSFNTENPEIAFPENVVERMLCGIGSHHAGILPAHKAFVESLFRMELMRVVFATETLAAGINMPARTTVICSMAKRGDNTGMELLETSNLLQMAGRAGRRGMDTEGACIIAATSFEGPEDAITILTNEIKPVVSQFSPSYSLAVNLIERGLGKLDLAKTIVEKSFAVWESRQKENDFEAMLSSLNNPEAETSPQEKFLNTLQLTLEKELIEARAGTSPTGTSQSKVSKLDALVTVLADHKKLKKSSKKYTGALQMLDLERSTLKFLEQELNELEVSVSDTYLPSDTIHNDVKELMTEIKTQRQRVAKRENELSNTILFAMSKVATNRMNDAAEGSDTLRQALELARFDEEDSVFSGTTALLPDELNEYIKKTSTLSRTPLLDLTTKNSILKENEDESWSQMLALVHVLEVYGCLIPLPFKSAEEINHQKYEVASGGIHVGSLGMDNSLWQVCALGGAWDVAYDSINLDEFTDPIPDLELDWNASIDENSRPNVIPKPQSEAEALTNHLCHLSSSEMAGYVSSLVADAPRRSDSAIVFFDKLSLNQQRVVKGALLSLERLIEVQRKYAVDDNIGRCQLELSSCNVVTAWASGCSWNEAVELSGVAPGDLVRTLSRALDALRQLGNLPYVPARKFEGDGVTIRKVASGIHPRVRALCRAAANEMDRYPVKDFLPFEIDESDISEVSDAEEGDAMNEVPMN